MTKIKTRIQYLEATEDILDFAINKLEEYTEWNVHKFPGTGYSDLFKFLPEIQLPAAVVCYNSSTYNKKTLPARTIEMEVVIAVEFYSEGDKTTLRQLLHKVIELLDGEVYGDKVRFDLASDSSIDFGSGIVACVVKLQVLNY
jgi:hypothetical protein